MTVMSNPPTARITLSLSLRQALREALGQAGESLGWRCCTWRAQRLSQLPLQYWSHTYPSTGRHVGKENIMN